MNIFVIICEGGKEGYLLGRCLFLSPLPLRVMRERVCLSHVWEDLLLYPTSPFPGERFFQSCENPDIFIQSTTYDVPHDPRGGNVTRDVEKLILPGFAVFNKLCAFPDHLY